MPDVSPIQAIILLVLLPFLLLPSIIAFARGIAHRWWVLLVNVLLGGTGIGWIVALVWALVAEKPTATNTNT